MREYGKVAPQFWIGRTGKALRAAGKDAQIAAMYLLTNPHANMIGLYYLPITYLVHETGLSMEEAKAGLEAASATGFCRYDEDTEMVWVVEMARFQIGEKLDPKDKRSKGVQSEYDNLPANPFLGPFFARYSEALGMVCERHFEPLRSPFEAPSKPLRSQEQEQEQEKEQEPPSLRSGGAGGNPTPCEPDGPDAPPSASPRLGTRLPEDWTLPAEWRAWALQEQPTWSPEHAGKVADAFRDYWVAKAGKDGRKASWEATWRNWVRRESPMRGDQAKGAGKLRTDERGLVAGLFPGSIV